MSWRDRYKAASFRGVSFEVMSHAYTGGRRTVVHEFPGGDIPVVEDLGQKSREFSVEAFVFGADYDGQRDALREALELVGPGTLVHPYLGRMRVQVAAVSLRETTEEGGAARFTITFQQADIVQSAAVPDTAGLLKAASSVSIAGAIASFGKVMNVLAMPAALVAELQQDLGSILSAAEGVVAGITNSASALIHAPADMASNLAGTLHSIQSLAGSPERAFNIYRQLWNAQSTRVTPPQNTGSRLQQATDRAAMATLVQQISVSESAASLADIEFTSATQALGLRDALADAMDDKMLTADDQVYDNLRALRAAMIIDVAARGGNLARIVSFIPPATLPALVLAHQLYGDATRADDIIARNGIPHPGFVAGGQPLEVLSDD